MGAIVSLWRQAAPRHGKDCYTIGCWPALQKANPGSDQIMREGEMATYLLEVSYTSAALAALVKNPQDRIQVVSKSVKKLGGKVTGFWFAFGDSDVIGILDMPDNASMAAFALAIGAGGACSKVKTTALLTVSEALSAMEKASTTGYKPAGS
jgi:uncharacterized protein with GYD domain